MLGVLVVLGAAALFGRRALQAVREERPQVVCPVCQEVVVGAACVAKRPGGGLCGHSLCSDCFRSYAKHEIAENRRAAVRCPALECQAVFSAAVLTEALADAPRELSLFHDLLAEALVEQKLYCPYEGCAALMDAGSSALANAECLSCHRLICVPCRSAYHAGLSCVEYQALPATQRGSFSERALRELAADAGWRACPTCGNMVERQPHGCNFMMCRCRSAFCFACGAAYLHLRPTAANVHGQPGCNCGIFDPMVEDEAQRARRMQREREHARADLEARIARARRDAIERVQLAGARAHAGVGQAAQEHPAAHPLPAAHVELRQRFVRKPTAWGRWQMSPAGPRYCNVSRTHVGCRYGRRCWHLHVDENPQ